MTGMFLRHRMIGSQGSSSWRTGDCTSRGSGGVFESVMTNSTSWTGSWLLGHVMSSSIGGRVGMEWNMPRSEAGEQ